MKLHRKPQRNKHCTKVSKSRGKAESPRRAFSLRNLLWLLCKSQD